MAKPTQKGKIRNYKSGDWLKSAIQQKTLNPDVVKTGSEVRRNISAEGPKNIYNTEKSLLSDSAIKRIRAEGGNKALREKVRQGTPPGRSRDTGGNLLQEATPGGGVGRKPRMKRLKPAPDRQTYPTVDVRSSKPQARSVQTSTATGGKDTNVQMKGNTKSGGSNDFLAGTEYEDLRY